MFELFMVGTFWFWALIVAEIVLLFMFMEYENGAGAWVSVGVFLACLQWFGNVDIINYAMTNPFTILLMVGAYFAIGAIWGVIKWMIFCKDRLEDYEELKVQFLRENGAAGEKQVPVHLRKQWANRLHSHVDREHGNLSEAPLVRNNKARIMRWMSFWVVSIIWSFINDFLKRGWRMVYLRMANFLQGISDKMFAKADVAGDLNIPDEN